MQQIVSTLTVSLKENKTVSDIWDDKTREDVLKENALASVLFVKKAFEETGTRFYRPDDSKTKMLKSEKVIERRKKAEKEREELEKKMKNERKKNVEKHDRRRKDGVEKKRKAIDDIKASRSGRKDNGKEVKQGGSRRDVKQGGNRKEVKQKGDRKEVKQRGDRKEMKQGGARREMKQRGARKEVNPKKKTFQKRSNSRQTKSK
ncbi:MAG: uncharacterized protein A8A55_0514 [Amphiamblys sp. WSBS2006]|nr:MAG: uncharacterized protein A8A55_0514 [Amphiamblys sp. WSBS2006]